MTKYTTNDSNIKEARSIIDDETNRKVEDVKTHIDFICNSLRLSAKAQTNHLMVAIQQLTVEEFCLKYCGSAQVFLSQQNKSTKRKSTLERNREIAIKKTKSSNEKGARQENIEPLVVQLKRSDHSDINIQLEPGRELEELGHFKVNGLNKEAISKLSNTHKARLCKQIQDIQDELETLKKELK